jgi:hypothetical protein
MNKNILVKIGFLSVSIFLLSNNKVKSKQPAYIKFPTHFNIIENNAIVKSDSTLFDIGELKFIKRVNGDCNRCIREIAQIDSFFNNLQLDISIFYFLQTADTSFFVDSILPKINSESYLILNCSEFDRLNKVDYLNNYANCFLVNSNLKILTKGYPIYSKYSKEEYIKWICKGIKQKLPLRCRNKSRM